MDLKGRDSTAIGLEFNTDNQHQFATFTGDESDNLVIHHVRDQLQIPAGDHPLIIPPEVISHDNAGPQGGTEAVATEGSVQTQAPGAATDKTVEGELDCEEQLCSDMKGKKSPVNVNQSWFTGKHAKETLQEQGHSWKMGMWSKEEISILIKNIEDYVKARQLKDPLQVIFQLPKEDRKDFYRTIASGLNRPLFAVYRRVQRMYDQKNYVGKYSAADIERLKGLRAALGNDWAQIGARMGRSASSVKDKCRLLKETCQQGKWRFDEEERLTAAVYEVTKSTPGESVTGGIPWQQVAEKVVTRTEKQCRAKWLNYLNWKHTGGTEWDKADDDKLLEIMQAYPGKDEHSVPWQQLAKGWKSVRSPQWLRSKWWSLKRTIPNYEMYTIPDLVEQLKKSQRKQRVRFDVFPSQMGHPPFKIARLEIPNLGNMKNRTVTLHLPLSMNLGGSTIAATNIPVSCTSGQLGILAETLRSSRAAGTSSGQVLVQSVEPQGTIADDHRLILQAMESTGAHTDNHQIVVQSLEPPGATIPNNQQVVVTPMAPTEGNQIVTQEQQGTISSDHHTVVESMEPPRGINSGDHQIMVQSMEQIGDHQMVVTSLQDGETSQMQCAQQIELHDGASEHLVIETNQEADEESHDIRSHDEDDDLGVRVSLHDSHLGVVSGSSHQLDHLTSEMSQSDHTDGIEDSHLNSQSQLIGTDAVLSSQQEVTSSELQVVAEGCVNEDEKLMVITRSAPPSEGLPASHDSNHLENSVFNLTSSLLSCQSDHAYLMEPPSELETKAKLPISSHS